MRNRAPAALLLSLLLCACAVDTGNQTDNLVAADANLTDPARADSAAPANGATAPQQPGDGTQTPEPSGDVSLSAAPVQATEGSTMTLTLRNGSSERIGYNLCTSALETSAGRPVPTNRVCTMELRTLEPGRAADYRYELPVNMVEGRYRFLTQVEWMQSGRRSGIRSNSFEARAD